MAKAKVKEPPYKLPVKWMLGKAAEVWWNDSMSHSGGWLSPGEYKDNLGTGPLRSIGYVLKADAHSIALAQSQNGINHIAQVIEIPSSEVMRIHVIDIDQWPNQATKGKPPKSSGKSKTKSGSLNSMLLQLKPTLSAKTTVAPTTSLPAVETA